MKYLIIFGVIAIIFYALLFWRLRRYFPLARQIFGLTRDLYRVTRNKEGPQVVTRSKKTDAEKLVRCASCGTWIPEGRAVSLRPGGAAYCSTSCMERAGAEEPRSTHRSAKG